MKKNIFAIIIMVISLLFIFNITSYADIITNSTAIKEDLNDNLDVILETVNDLASEDLKNIVTEDSINFNKVIKQYSQINILEYDKINNEMMMDLTENAEKFYYLPIYYDDYTLLFSITKGTEATEEQKNSGVFTEKDIEYIERVANKWHASSYAICSYEWDDTEYIEGLLKSNNIYDANIYIIGGVSTNLERVAVVCPDNEEAQFIILDGWIENDNKIDYNSPDNKLYSYNEIKEIASLSSPQDDLISGNGSNFQQEENQNYTQYILIGAAAAILLASAVTAICITKKRKKHVNTENI